MKKIKLDYPLVIIYWLDHTANAEWKELPDVKKEEPMLCQTIGWLVDEDKTTYKLCDSLTADAGYGGLNIILKSCVTEIWDLSFPGKKKGRN